MSKKVETDHGVRIRQAQKVPAPTRTKHDKKQKGPELGPGVPGIRDVYPGSEYFQPGSRVKRFPDPGSGSGYASASKNLSFFTQKIVSKLSEI